MNKPKLMVMCGLSASGKSTIAKEFAEKENYEIVSSDAIRAEICPGGVTDQSMNDQVFKLYHQRICGWLMVGRNVIADATNITLKSRRGIFETIKDIDCEKIAYVMTKDFDLCIYDDLGRGEKRVSSKVIAKQLYKYQIPFYEEGFDKIVIHKTITGADFSKTTSFFLKLIEEMNGFNQKTPYHTLDLLSHCQKAKKNFKNKIGYIWTEYVKGAELHDVGKLMTWTIDLDTGIAHYYNHENVGAYYLLSNYHHFETIGYTHDEILNILFLVNYHMMPFSWTSEKAHRTWKRRFGDYKYKLLLDFNDCDRKAK